MEVVLALVPAVLFAALIYLLIDRPVHRLVEFATDKQPYIKCCTCDTNVISHRKPHDVAWVNKYECPKCGEVMYVTFEHGGFGLVCDEQGNLM